jgi:hypothetical protein
MNFRTEIPSTPSQFQINHQSGVVTLGSCFSDAIGNKFLEHKFKSLINPLGTIFNPISLSNLIQYCLSNSRLTEDSYIYTRNQWYNYLLHSSVHADSKEQLEEKCKTIFSELSRALNTAQYLIITLGTAYVYQTIDQQLSVSNCHKIPAIHFSKILLTSQQITDSLRLAIQRIRETNPDLNIIITVSPVRHIKDTLVLNQVSKSTLRVAVNQLCEQMDKVEYFPSYEIMLDELRDYRFYKEDMIHPTAQAEEFIWQKFSDTYFSREIQQLNRDWKIMLKSIYHKAFNPQSEEHQKHIEKTLIKLQTLLPYIDCSSEIEFVKKQIQN